MSRRRRGAMLAAVLVMGASSAAAQRVQPWPDLFVSAPVGGGLTLTGEGIGRIADDRHTSQAEERLQVAYAAYPGLAVGGGWVHVYSFNANGSHTVENQIVEQIGWRVVDRHGLVVSTRTRLEQRWIGGADAVGWRWRQLVRLAVPLGGGATPRAVAWVEPFVTLNHTAFQTRSLDQLRSFAGVNVPLSRHADVEIGYLNQRLYRATGDLAIDVVPVILSYRF